MVSGESFLRGLQASPPNLSFIAAFCAFHEGRSSLLTLLSAPESSTMLFGKVLCDLGGLRSRRRTAEKDREDCEGLNKVWCGVKAGLRFVKERMKRPSVIRVQLLQFMVHGVCKIGGASISNFENLWRTDFSRHKRKSNQARNQATTQASHNTSKPQLP